MCPARPPDVLGAELKRSERFRTVKSDAVRAAVQARGAGRKNPTVLIARRAPAAILENLRKTLGAEFRGQAALEQRIKEICQTRVRYGYRRCAVKAGLSGQNKTSRIYRELGLQLRKKMLKRRVKAKLRFAPRSPARRRAPIASWTY